MPKTDFPGTQNRAPLAPPCFRAMPRSACGAPLGTVLNLAPAPSLGVLSHLVPVPFLAVVGVVSRHKRIHSSAAPCPNIPPGWPFPIGVIGLSVSCALTACSPKIFRKAYSAHPHCILCYSHVLPPLATAVTGPPALTCPPPRHPLDGHGAALNLPFPLVPRRRAHTRTMPPWLALLTSMYMSCGYASCSLCSMAGLGMHLVDPPLVARCAHRGKSRPMAMPSCSAQRSGYTKAPLARRPRSLP